MSGPLKRAFQAFRPVMVLVAETEFWPNWFLRTGTTVSPFLVNGRISEKSFPTYKRLKALFAPALNCFSECMVQDQARTHGKAGGLGGFGQADLHRGPNEIRPSHSRGGGCGEVQGKPGPPEIRHSLTLGSIREGEDDLLLPLVPQILRFSPDIKLLIAPRHLKNAAVFQEKLKRINQTSVLRSELEKAQRVNAWLCWIRSGSYL